uniref:uncharacterized protein n=1 Tax=Myxine glutinosa TaxID=7769 RepID=UPI00358F06B4
MPVKPPIYLKPTQMRGQTLRDVLSGDMISPPLGDFRHMMHVGSAAASKPSSGLSTFGDLSFLWGQVEGAGNPAGPNEDDGVLGAAMLGGLGSDATSPVLRNAVLLPLGGSEQALVLPAWATKKHRQVDDRIQDLPTNTSGNSSAVGKSNHCRRSSSFNLWDKKPKKTTCNALYSPALTCRSKGGSTTMKDCHIEVSTSPVSRRSFFRIIREKAEKFELSSPSISRRGSQKKESRIKSKGDEQVEKAQETKLLQEPIPADVVSTLSNSQSRTKLARRAASTCTPSPSLSFINKLEKESGQLTRNSNPTKCGTQTTKNNIPASSTSHLRATSNTAEQSVTSHLPPREESIWKPRCLVHERNSLDKQDVKPVQGLGPENMASPFGAQMYETQSVRKHSPCKGAQVESKDPLLLSCSSLLSLDIDLGPSMLDDVLGVMSKGGGALQMVADPMLPGVLRS